MSNITSHALVELFGHAFAALRYSPLGSLANCSNLVIRSSISRTLVRYSSSLWPSCVLSFAAQRAGVLADEIENRAVRLLPDARFLRRSSAVPAAEQPLEHAAADSAPAAIGVVALRQETLYWYAHA